MDCSVSKTVCYTALQGGAWCSGTAVSKEVHGNMASQRVIRYAKRSSFYCSF
jgi:hypothetical protein